MSKSSPNQLMLSGTPASQKKTLQPRLSSFNLNSSKEQERSIKSAKNVTKGAKTSSKKATHVGKERPSKQDYDKEATMKFNAMIDGDLTDLPPLPKSMVRIFLSSTFSDMRQERNILTREAFPKLRDFCAGLGLAFQVVDMRWGVTENSQNDHSVEKICLLEVKNCQNVSKGPNFVVLSGDRYGFRPIPSEIEVEEFDQISAMATNLNLADLDLLKTWYKLDENSIPSVYLLQPIRSKFTFFGDYSPACDEPRKKDTADWWKTFGRLQEVLRKCAVELCKQKRMSNERKHTYFYSVTECEIEEGILTASDVNSHCLVYQRLFQQLNKASANDKDASRFKEFVTQNGVTQVDPEAEELRTSLIEDKLKSLLPTKNIGTYAVPWIPGGIEPSQHKEYLDQLCERFVSDCKTLVQKAMEAEQRLIQMSNYYTDYAETIHHLRFCLTKCQTFCGQEKILDAAKSYVLDESLRRPLIIHAESGAGKTSIMAMIMKCIPEWLDNRPHTKLIRFLGTTPNTNNIYNVLFGVLGQLSDAFDMIMSPIRYKDMKSLVDYIPRYLRQIAGIAKEPVIILLDSIDQLNPRNKAYNMEWLPTLLPQNVKLILSTLPREHGILDNIKKLLPQEECYVRVPLLSHTAAQLIADTYLKVNKRKLTEQQMKLLLSGFRESSSPLFLKLLLDEAKKWTSYVNYATLDVLPLTVQEAISKLFENLENKFGFLLVSHALGYITVGVDGLTEIEIEDVLSCDDAVLNDLYRYHDPPVPGHVRLPPLLWARIRFDLKEYLVERLSHGKNTLQWYHRQFIETASMRYTNDGKDKELHKNLTDVYLQDSGIRRTIVLKNRQNLEIPDADRQVTPQAFEAKNKRKLACLPYHAMQAYSVLGPDITKAEIFCNFNFLCTKIAAFSLVEAVTDLSNFLEKNDDEEVTVLRNYLSVAKDNLTQPTRLAVCLLAYINPSEDFQYICDLQRQCKKYLQSQNTPLLVPEFPCLAPRQDASSALNTSLQGYTTILSKSENVFLLKAKKDISSGDDKVQEHAIFNTNTEDIQPTDLTSVFKAVIGQNYILIGEKLHYITKDSYVAYNLYTKTAAQFVFADRIPKWSPRSSTITQMSVDIEGDIGILIMKSSLIHVNLGNMTFVQQFDCRRKQAKIQNSLVFKTVESFKVVAVGRTINPSDDQGPDNSSFITVFESEKETPLKFLQLEKEINSNCLSLTSRNDWTVGVLMESQKVNENTNDENRSDTSTLLIFENNPPFTYEEITMSGNVQRLSGNPYKPEALALSNNGSAFIVDIAKRENQMEIKLNHPIKNFDVLWEDRIAFLCFGQGNINMYDFENDNNLGAFSAHSTQIQDIFIVDQQAITLGSSADLKLWSVQQLVEKAKHTTEEKTVGTDLLNQMDVISVIVTGAELVTCSTDGFLRIWDIDSQTLQREYNIGMEVTLIQEMVDDALVLLDETTGKLLLFDKSSGQAVINKSELPNKVLTVAKDHGQESLFIISELSKKQIQIQIYNIPLGKFTKSFLVQKGFTYVRLSASLTLSERFLVLKAEISDAEYKTVADMWKNGQFGQQPHKHKFSAIDLSQGNGGLLHCYRQLTKIPFLGVGMCQYTANTVLITTRRWLVVWDIPSGNCDQRRLKGDIGGGMFYRPQWLGQQCRGTSNALSISNKKELVAVGSEDGYVFIYDAKIGNPRNNMKPTTFHKADVHILAISPNSKWIASSCRGSVLKLWDSDTGKEVFSVRLDAAAQQMMFTSDSRKLVLYTGSQTTRVLILGVHDGTKQ